MTDFTSIPWPNFLVRYITSDDPQSYEDLIWSVGGSPPYGGVSYEEASAIYTLLEQFIGPDTVDISYYKKALLLVKNSPGKTNLLLAFQKHDEIISNPDDYNAATVKQGYEYAAAYGSPFLIQHFNALLSGLFYKAGDLESAAKLLTQTINTFEPLVKLDQAYLKKYGSYVQNLCVFMANDGKLTDACKILDKNKPYLEPNHFHQIKKFLAYE